MSAGAMILIAVLALLLVAAAWTDIRSRTIPNWLNAAVALLAIPFWWASGLDPWSIGLQVAVAGAVFAAFALLFALGAMGGGDVKLVAAVALWLPWPAVLALLVLMSLVGGVITAVMVARRRLARGREKLEIPYGVAIAGGALWVIAQPFLYQFG